MARQLKLIHYSNQFGGSLSAGKRKSKRPVAVKRPMHLVLKSSRAKGTWSLLNRPHAVFIRLVLATLAKRYCVRVMEVANVGNHIHLLMQAKDRDLFLAFRRVLSGRIAMRVIGGRKGNKVGKFWDFVLYSRIVEWGKDLRNVVAYILQNGAEAAGVVVRRKGGGKYAGAVGEPRKGSGRQKTKKGEP